MSQNQSAAMPDWEQLARAAESAAAQRSEERLQPIFDLVERLAHPTTVAGEGGTWVLGVAVDRTTTGQQAAIVALDQVFEGYFDEYKKVKYADIVSFNTLRSRVRPYLRGRPWKKWAR